MHTYERLPLADRELVDLSELRLRSVHDVVQWAARDVQLGSVDALEVLHLDEAGGVTCCYLPCSCASLLTWAMDPFDLQMSRLGGLDAGGCGTDWLIVDSRTSLDGGCIPPCDADQASFKALCAELADIGIRLADAIVVDDRDHWWSLRELTTGSWEWGLARSAE